MCQGTTLEGTPEGSRTGEAKTKGVFCGVFASLAVLIALSGSAMADEQLAKVENLGGSLVFHPVVEFARLILTVSGPCDFHYRQSVSRGEPIFRLDKTTIDGSYSYNLMREESVDPDVIKKLLEARKADDPEVPRALCRDGRLPGPPASQSEGFRVLRGEIIFDPGAVEKAGRTAGGVVSKAAGLGAVAPKDFVINDDLIVDGSACIGFDCVNGEVFSFDTIRLKENNLRIKFDDTSVAASFPRNDWQLTANDSANGGTSKFSIDDISGARTPFTVEAGARSNSLYVDDGGRIGSRTSTPSVEIHTIDGDTPTLRLQQDGSSGFAPQTWDVAGNETNFFVRDVTNGSALPFRIRPGAPSSSIFVNTNGDVGFGTSSPTANIHVVDGGTAGQADALAILRNNGPVFFRLEDTVSNGGQNWFLAETASDNFQINSETTAGAEFNLSNTGALTIAGPITTGGPVCAGGCDRVFSPEFELESIRVHAARMWEKASLPAVGPTAEDGSPFNLTEKTAGILTELEKAHIYIEQLEQRLSEKEATIEDVSDRVTRLERRLLEN